MKISKTTITNKQTPAVSRELLFWELIKKSGNTPKHKGLLRKIQRARVKCCICNKYPRIISEPRNTLRSFVKVRAPCLRSQGRKASKTIFKERKFQVINTTGVVLVLTEHVVSARPGSQHTPTRMSSPRRLDGSGSSVGVLLYQHGFSTNMKPRQINRLFQVRNKGSKVHPKFQDK